MRNGVLEVMGHIHLKVLSKDDLDSKMKAARDQFLEKLEVKCHCTLIHLFVKFLNDPPFYPQI